MRRFWKFCGIRRSCDLKKTNEFSQGEVKLLEYLYIFQDGITAGELSDKINISTARVATILNGLEKKHLIRRCADDTGQAEDRCISDGKGAEKPGRKNMK
jgi:DNA-binding MarR family transcriptional regulator